MQSSWYSGKDGYNNQQEHQGWFKYSISSWPYIIHVLTHEWSALMFWHSKKGKCRPYSITERRVPVFGSQPAGDVSHKPGGRLSLLLRQACSYPRNPSEGCYQFHCFVNRGTMGVNSLPKTVTRQSRGCYLNPGHSAPESSTLTTRLPSHPSDLAYWLLTLSVFCY